MNTRKQLGQFATVPVGGLFDSARAGCDHAWSELVGRYTGQLTELAASYRLGADAQDAVQDTWLRLFEKGRALRDPNAVVGWLRTTLRRECLLALSRRQRLDPLDPADTDVVNPGDIPVEDVVVDRLSRDEARARLERALRSLPPRRRQLLRMLSQSDEVSYRSVARRLSIPVGSIGPTRARALHQLRQALAKEES